MLILLLAACFAVPSPKCQAEMDAYCTHVDHDCVPALAEKHCQTTQLYARYDLMGHEEWRCYSPSSLSGDHAHYSNGTCFCTRDGQLKDVLAKCGDLPSSVVFSANEAGVSCYRIPSVVRAGSVLVAFAEARHGSCGDGDVWQIATKRSMDGGKTWSSVAFAVGNQSYMVGNPCSVYTHSKKIILVFVKHKPGCVGDCGSGNAMVVSSDDGVSWTEPQDLSHDFGPASGSLPGPGTVLQLAPPGGRLLVVSHHSAYQRDYVTYSDNDGKSWTTISQTFPKMDEAALTQTPNGNVMLNMRHQDSPKRGRAVAISTDGGETFGSIHYDPALISPVCEGSIATFGNTTYFSNPASATGRDHLSIKRSTDNAQTWSAPLLVLAEASAGYSCLVVGALNSTHGGVLFEGPATTVRFAAFPLLF